MPKPARKLTEAEYKMIENMSGVGLSEDKMSFILGFSPSTMDRLKTKDKRLVDALSKGRSLASYNVCKTFYEMATSGKCPTMTIFWLKTRERMRETNHVEIDLKQSRELSDDEKAQLAKQALIAMGKTE